MEEVPFDDRNVPKAEIDWDRSCWWWYLLTRAIHPAIRSTSLALSLLVILLLWGGWSLGQSVFSPELPGAVNQPIGGPDWGSFRFAGWTYEALSITESLWSRPWTVRQVAFLSFEFLWVSLVLSLGGGILARRSMIELGQRTVAPWLESIRLVLKRWQSFVWSSGMHIISIGFLLVPALVGGLLCRLGSVGAIIGGILLLLFYPIVISLGRLSISLVVCFPLSVCAIAAEKKADAFEGFSRSNAYFFQRPVVAVLCVGFLLCIGVVGEQLVAWTFQIGWRLMESTFQWSAGRREPTAYNFIVVGAWFTESLIGAYWFSYFWSASGGLYLVLRRLVDNKDVSEIDMVESTEVQDLPEIPNVGQAPNSPT
jgi:hypothetical protein